MAVFIGLLLFAILLWVIAHLPRKSSGRKNRIFFAQVHGINHKNDDGSSRQEIIGALP